MALTATVLLALLLFSLCMVVASLGVALIWPGMSGWIRSAHPRTRTWAALAAACAPFAVSTGVVVLCLLPGVLPLLGIADDHCAAHPDHPHLCLVHPTAAMTPALVLTVMALAGPLAVAALRRLAKHLAALRPVLDLRRAASDVLGPGIRRISSPRFFAVTVGLLRPVVIVSSRLIERLDEAEVGVVLAHERAHVRRRDPLVRSMAALLSFSLPPTCRRRILDELELATEQACDEEAAHAVGDRLLVAETLLAVERLTSVLAVAPAVNASGIEGGTLPARIRGLLAPPVHPTDCRLLSALAGAAAFALIATGPIHHFAEHLLARVFGGH
jgi:hypothetical protein